ncbi:MAG: hypothetical protein P4K98_06300 [Bryobacteraceae bacterium]|nr:hypothetical protein [Bryobacteraceae bacterium]
MVDLDHQFGCDLAVGPTGDLAVTSDVALGQQRVLRRLLTNAGDYIWHTNYGAGLPQFVGQPADTTRIRAVIRGQIFKEVAVARTPEPTIDVEVSESGVASAEVLYGDALTGETQVLNLTMDAGA